jgi:LPS-assembly lipoprotein
MPIGRALLGIAVALLGGCGFHLRGEAQLPAAAQTLTIQAADPVSPLKRDLEAALRRSGATVKAAGGEGVATLKLPVIKLATEPVSISKNARVKEFRVKYQVEVELDAPDGSVLLKRTPIELTREYSYDETQALGAQAEEELLRKEMGRDMVQQVLRRLDSVK